VSIFELRSHLTGPGKHVGVPTNPTRSTDRCNPEGSDLQPLRDVAFHVRLAPVFEADHDGSRLGWVM
jgi:hypothetical protein